jgi:hypothetical protein
VESGTFPAIPVHQDDPIPHLNLALRTCGHVEQWQHVPGLTAVRGVHRGAPKRPLFPSPHPQSPTHLPLVFVWSSVVFPACRRLRCLIPLAHVCGNRLVASGFRQPSCFATRQRPLVTVSWYAVSALSLKEGFLRACVVVATCRLTGTLVLTPVCACTCAAYVFVSLYLCLGAAGEPRVRDARGGATPNRGGL